MTSHELFARLSSDEAAVVFSWLHDHDRAAYKTTAGLLATRRKLRPVFVERKPRDERQAWMKEALGRPANSDLAAEILQAWTMGANGQAVCAFLDSLGIPHDGKGLLESLPPEPPDADVRRAVDELFSNYSAVAVRVYLHLFSSMEMTEWPGLRALVSTDPRLCLNPQTP
ncbi:MAG: hypothetical protein WCS65_00820 [Verrucomicrobiae bacterium]